MCRNNDGFLRDIRSKIIEPSALIHYEHHAFCITQLLFLVNLSILHNMTSLTKLQKRIVFALHKLNLGYNEPYGKELLNVLDKPVIDLLIFL